MEPITVALALSATLAALEAVTSLATLGGAFALASAQRRGLGLAWLLAPVFCAGAGLISRFGGPAAPMLPEWAFIAAPWLGLLLAGFVAWRTAPKISVSAWLGKIPDATRELPAIRRFIGRLHRLSWRLALLGAGKTLACTLWLATVAALALVLIDRLLLNTGLELPAVLASAAAIGLLGGIITGVAYNRVPVAHAAIQADLALNLRERVSSALTISAAGPFAEALRQDALLHVERARLDRVAPARWPWQGSAWLVTCAALAVAYLFAGNARWLENSAPKAPPRELATDLQQAAKILSADRAELKKIVDEVGLDETKKLYEEAARMAGELKNRPQLEKQDERQATEDMARLSDLQDRAAKLQQALEAMQQDAQKMQPNNGQTPADKFESAMAQNNFQKAAEALNELQQQLDSAMKTKHKNRGQDTPESQQQQQQLQQQAQRFGKMAQQMSPNNPLAQQLQNLSQNLPQLSPQAQQQLQNLMNQCQNFGQSGPQSQANQQLLQMLQNQLQNARGCLGNGSGQNRDNKGAMALAPGNGNNPGQMANLRQMAGQCQGGNGQQGGQPGIGRNGGVGVGPRPLGQERPDVAEVPWLQRGQLQKGDIIASMRRMGIPEPGQARVEYVEAYDQSVRQAEDAMTQQNIPPEYRGLARQYFEAINPK